MLRSLRHRITKILKSLRMTEVQASAETMNNHEDKGNKRSLEDADSEEQKRVKTEASSGRLPKRKIAMLIGYNGKGYYGIQINKGFKTIEDDILKALVEVKCIPQDHADTPQKMKFQRAARTDKNVSAVMNVLSMKMIVDIENLVEKINSQLPDQIRVFGYRRTTGSFDSKNYCDNRTYVYICPTYAFAPIETLVTDQYRMTDEVHCNVNRLLNRFVGTHCFHNYTSKVQATERRAKRYIISINCEKPFVRDGCEYCLITVKGQSFMMHQIRKMIGMVIAIIRGNCGEDVLDKSWEPERVDVPKAPGLGLCLQQPHYDVYNKRYGNDGLHLPLDWDEEKEAVEKFREEYIVNDIIKTESEEKVMLEWLGYLQCHTFDVVDDQETAQQRFSRKRFLEKVSKEPSIVITPDSRKRRSTENSPAGSPTEKGDNCDSETSKDMDIKMDNVDSEDFTNEEKMSKEQL